MPSKKRLSYSFLAAVAVILIVIAIVLLLGKLNSGLLGPNNSVQNAVENASLDPYAHLGTANFALIAPQSVLLSNHEFVSLARKYYNFLYASASNSSTVEGSPFVILVVNDSAPYTSLALDAVNSSTLDYVMNDTTGTILTRSDVWAANQTVFLLVGYRSNASLSSALQGFFMKPDVLAPQKASGKFVNYSGATANDPTLQAYLDGSYPLSPSDPSLQSPYNYYVNFAYLLYQAPVLESINPGFSGNASGFGLPMQASMCVPPPPPPDGSSICFGNYIAMPMFQFGTSAPAEPQWSLGSDDCNYFGISDCIDTSGWAVSGVDPPLPYSEIPSIFYGVSSTKSRVPLSMTGTGGPITSYDPLTWWYFGPGSYGTTTGGEQQNLISTNQTQLLMDAGVEMFSTPYDEVPYGSFTTYNQSNSAYTCSSNSCGMQFNYAIYALVSENSTIPSGVYISSPANYIFAPGSGYYPVLQPTTLSTPKVVVTPSATYYFSYWSVNEELGGKQYYQRFNTSNATLTVIGPTQIQAIYTHRSAPGQVTAAAEFMTPSAYLTCPPPINCSISQTVAIQGVNISIRSLNGSVSYSNVTGTDGRFTTPVMPAGCYNVKADKRGYAFITEPNPLCVNGPSGTYAVDISPFIFNVSWPRGYAYGTAPTGSSLGVNLTLLYSEGVDAGNVSISATAGSGSISGPSFTSADGTADYTWTTGTSGGIYLLNFTATGLFTGRYSYSMPVLIYPKGSSHPAIVNVTLSKSTLQVSNTSAVYDNVTVRVCKFILNGTLNYTEVCGALPAVMAISNPPVGLTMNFAPNPAPSNIIRGNSATALSVISGKSANPGTYPAAVTATVTLNGSSYVGSAPLTIVVNSGASGSGGGSVNQTSGCGEIIGQVYNSTGGHTSANVTITNRQSGALVYNDITSTGEFSTGYTIPFGNYTALARSLQQGTYYVYGVEDVNVTACVPVFVQIPQQSTTTTTSTSTTSTSSTSSTSTSTSTSTTSTTSTTTVLIQPQ